MTFWNSICVTCLPWDVRIIDSMSFTSETNLIQYQDIAEDQHSIIFWKKTKTWILCLVCEPLVLMAYKLIKPGFEGTTRGSNHVICSIKKVFLKILQNSVPESQACNFIKKETVTGVCQWILQNF